ncbi:MAG: thioredoxin family protein [Steroidobacteraceae bacterium]
MSVRRCASLALCVVMGLAGCNKPGVPPPTVPAQATTNNSIKWFDGDVNAAFARAAAEGKPVFLYWGASWCPPCHELKATVFSRPDFIEKLKLFVPVYIDGDAPGAQKLGDEFHVSGYPSVVVLRADRTELARINGGMDLSQYAEVLDLVLGDVRPVKEILASLNDTAVPISRDDCRRLAYNGWESDGSPGELVETAARIQRAAQSCPADAQVERARLIAFAAAAASDAEEEQIAAGKAPTPQLVARVQAVYELLADRDRALAAADALQYLGTSFFKAAKQALPDRGAQLLERWSTVMDSAAGDTRFAETDQLAAVGMKLRAIKELGDGQIPATAAAAARQRVDAALARGQSGYARAGVVNSSLFVLDTLGDVDRLYAVTEAEMKTSHYPYYYMLDLADIEEERGNKTQAVTWLERAYRESQGAATRFQWGTAYVQGLIRMQPQDETRIRDVALAVLGELDGPDRIHRRTAMRLTKLDTQLREWNKGGAHKAAIAALRTRRDALCSAISAGDKARTDCEAFLKGI